MNNLLEPLSIPAYITVHLGSPASSAQNVTVPFPDYIKNVASSEIYSTWPEEALKANILAEISFALNRVYSEWYPAMGYDFDITNNTAFDQKFINGRNIYENISLERCVEKRTSKGGTTKSSVLCQVKYIREFLKNV